MKSYIMFGAGGTGSNFIAPALAYLNSLHTQRNEEWEFLIADGDNYETKNLARQIFDPRFTGMNKAEALAGMYSRYPVRAIPRFIGEEDLKVLMEEDVIVFIGVDNFSLRALVEQRALELDNCVILNAGNEMHDGNVQLWVRENGKNKTPRLSFCHPEIKYSGPEDRSAMTCLQVAQLPGGEQLIIANMAAAMNMLTMLWHYYDGTWKGKNAPTEIQFDLKESSLVPIDMRQRKGWAANKPVPLKRRKVAASV
jgi:hypothetical protein